MDHWTAGAVFISAKELGNAWFMKSCIYITLFTTKNTTVKSSWNTISALSWLELFTECMNVVCISPQMLSEGSPAPQSIQMCSKTNEEPSLSPDTSQCVSPATQSWLWWHWFTTPGSSDSALTTFILVKRALARNLLCENVKMVHFGATKDEICQGAEGQHWDCLTCTSPSAKNTGCTSPKGTSAF